MNCIDCRFWLSFDTEDPDESDLSAFGYCRRNPPQIVSTGTKADSDPIKIWENTFFPVTAEYQWCGEFDERD